jgi:hypothetical protein
MRGCIRGDLANFAHCAQALGADADLLGFAFRRDDGRLLDIRTPHAVGAALGKTDIVPERRLLSATLTFSHENTLQF